MTMPRSPPSEKTAATAQSSGRASRSGHRHERATARRCGGESLPDDSSRPGRAASMPRFPAPALL